MHINSSSNLNFQSKIKFVSSKEFDSHGFFDNFYCGKNARNLEESMFKSPKHWTHSIRTCTAGGIVDRESALSFHFFDCIQTLESVREKLADIIKKFNRNNISALIIGSKRLADRGSYENLPPSKTPLSIEIFEAVRSEINKFVSPSVFRTYKNNSSESDIGYSHFDDTWIINTNYWKHPQMPATEVDILTLDALKSNFEEIKIAPQDSLYIDNKEITKDMCPEIFE